ncbi:MAG: glutamate--tRNA ligase [Acidimicrobiales bacterium]|nr:glutamate--tRNA ligase [Acidimicrobiales bacterium]
MAGAAGGTGGTAPADAPAPARVGLPRVRFAPSPTGFLHVGSARAALYNWLFARHTGGTFVLRIEDTDTERNREEWVDGILSSLSWLGMEPDEGPYRQSERTEAYRQAVDALWEAGHLYACDCSREEIDARTKGNATPGYDGFCRDLGLERRGRALRFRVPDEGVTVVHDLIRGDVTFAHEAIEDFVVVKSSGAPLFVLANVVDDIAMDITHVIRGEDLLPSTPKGLLLWSALEGPETALPAFAHLPLLVNERRQKLSKRRDDVAVESYRERGYLAPALRNYLALLGWSDPHGREILTVEEMVGSFELSEVNHAPAFFDLKKLEWMNKEYLRAMPVDDFVEASRPWLAPDRVPWPPERFEEGMFRTMAPLVQERVAVLSEVPAMVDFLFLEEPLMDESSWASVAADEGARAVLEAALDTYSTCEWSAEALHRATQAMADSLDRKLNKAQAPIRVAVTGRRVGPPLFQSLEVLGREAVLERLRAARDRLGGTTG